LLVEFKGKSNATTLARRVSSKTKKIGKINKEEIPSRIQFTKEGKNHVNEKTRQKK